MWAELIGFAGVVAAALFGLGGVLHSARPPAHLADIEGLRTLVDELKADREDLRVQVSSRDGRIAALSAQLADLTAQLAAVSAELTKVTAELALERAAHRRGSGA